MHQVSVAIYAMNGALLFRKTMAPAHTAVGRLDMSFLPKGTYAVHIDNGAVLNQKIAVMR